VARLVRRESLPETLLDLHLEVELELLVELLVRPAAPEDRLQPKRRLEPPVRDAHRPTPPRAGRRARSRPTAAANSRSPNRAAAGRGTWASRTSRAGCSRSSSTRT